jgi:transcriptional regulator with XRE-family HTH domain
MKNTQQNIGAAIRRIRRRQRETQKRIGNAANTTMATVSRVELGEQWPSGELFFSIGKALRYSKPESWLRAIARELENHDDTHDERK